MSKNTDYRIKNVAVLTNGQNEIYFDVEWEGDENIDFYELRILDKDKECVESCACIAHNHRVVIKEYHLRLKHKEVHSETFHVELGFPIYEGKKVGWHTLAAYEPIIVDIYHESHILDKNVMDQKELNENSHRLRNDQYGVFYLNAYRAIVDGKFQEESIGTSKQPSIYDPTTELSKFKFPPSDILNDMKMRISVDQEEVKENKEKIKKALFDFDIPIVSIKATVGPTVTLYEIVLDKEVKIAKIRNHIDDIALRLSAQGVRVIAPIPGKGTIGIEVANKNPQIVSMRTIITSRKFQESKYELPIALGATISNDVYIADLTKMPHLIVAGAPRQGEFVGLNVIITSLLYKKHPAELKFVLIDPKMVEFSMYAKLGKHYLAKLPGEDESIITDTAKAVATLNSLCVEMDNRYNLLINASVRNIKDYNDKFKSNVLNPKEGHRFMPYLVVVIDELRDLIQTAGKEVQMLIVRIAQKARAVGIHLIIATQCPSINVITAMIRANFPARMAFKVSSEVDSKTILDTTGAQQLIGRGDMLLLCNSEVERVQCAFIDTPEIEAICEYISNQEGYSHPYLLPEPIVESGVFGASGGEEIVEERDPLFLDIARMIVNSNNASTSFLQRHYLIGYNRAGRIMDQMEAAGIVGPAQGGKPRNVLVDSITLETILNS